MRRVLVLITSALALATLATACGGSSDGGTDSTTTEAATTTTRPTYADLDPTAITFHAVEEIVTCDGGGVPGDTGSTTTAASTASTVPSVDGDLCYVLGPSGGDGTDLRDAKVYADGVGIEVAVREDSVPQLNELFNACHDADESCPPASTEGEGYAAIVIDGRVMSTPAVTEADLASSPFVITGDFDKAQATAIAAAINGY